MDEIVLDASAIIALLRDEPGRELVAASLAGGILSVVNAAEVLTWAVDRGAPIGQAESSLDALDLRVVPFDRDIAVAAAALRPATRKLGLSLGDRACLALAQALGVPALTADRAWLALDLGIEVRTIR